MNKLDSIFAQHPVIYRMQCGFFALLALCTGVFLLIGLIPTYVHYSGSEICEILIAASFCFLAGNHWRRRWCELGAKKNGGQL